MKKAVFPEYFTEFGQFISFFDKESIITQINIFQKT